VTQPDPPLGKCPAWCEKPEGHDWEDQWRDGLIRQHTYFVEVGGDRYHRIGIQETEQETGQRTRELVLDVEAPTNWGFMKASEGVRIINELMALAILGWPDGEVN
jgi:hypothetical protein